MIIAVFALESSVLRADKALPDASARKKESLQSVVRVVAFNAVTSFQDAAHRCAAYGASGEELATLQKSIGRLTSYPVSDLLNAKRQLADAAAEAGAYFF